MRKKLLLLIKTHGWNHLANTWFLLFFKKAFRYVLLRSNKRKGCFSFFVSYWLWISFSVCFKHRFVCLPWWTVMLRLQGCWSWLNHYFSPPTHSSTSLSGFELLCAKEIGAFHLTVLFVADHILICVTHVWSQFRRLFHSPDRVWIVDQSYLSPPMEVSSPPSTTRESRAVTACPHISSYLPSDKVSLHATWCCFMFMVLMRRVWVGWWWLYFGFEPLNYFMTVPNAGS